MRKYYTDKGFLTEPEKKQRDSVWEFCGYLEENFKGTDFGYDSFPELQWDYMVFSTIFKILKDAGYIAGAGYAKFRLTGVKREAIFDFGQDTPPDQVKSPGRFKNDVSHSSQTTIKAGVQPKASKPDTKPNSFAPEMSITKGSEEALNPMMARTVKSAKSVILWILNVLFAIVLFSATLSTLGNFGMLGKSAGNGNAPKLSGAAGVALIIVFFIVYFLPSIIAKNKRKENENKIFINNMLYGWTLIGWVICLVWALRDSVKKKVKK